MCDISLLPSPGYGQNRTLSVCPLARSPGAADCGAEFPRRLSDVDKPTLKAHDPWALVMKPGAAHLVSGSVGGLNPLPLSEMRGKM